MYVLSQNRSG